MLQSFRADAALGAKGNIGIIAEIASNAAYKISGEYAAHIANKLWMFGQ